MRMSQHGRKSKEKTEKRRRRQTQPAERPNQRLTKQQQLVLKPQVTLKRRTWRKREGKRTKLEKTLDQGQAQEKELALASQLLP